MAGAGVVVVASLLVAEVEAVSTADKVAEAVGVVVDVVVDVVAVGAAAAETSPGGALKLGLLSPGPLIYCVNFLNVMNQSFRRLATR
jgi:2-methylcitrate dehydratase PrpD